VKFCDALEKVCVDTVESGKMTKDLAASIHNTTNPPEGTFQTTEQFMETLGANLKRALGA
jgi:isocitrate dehydrogenase